MIRFQEEEVSINEICNFRTEIEAYPPYLEKNLFMECQLMFSDVINLGQNDLQQKDNQTQFKCASIFRCRINNIYSGIHEFVPILFDEQHFCLVNSTIHCNLFGF